MKKNHLIFTLILVVVYAFCACSDEAKDPGTIPFDPSKPVQVTEIGPKEGGIGTRVVVSGSNFGNDKSKVKLFFNEKEALVMNVNNNRIYAMVPKRPGDLSIVKVAIEKGKDPAGNPVYVEQELEGQQFTYFTTAAVTTIAGKLKTQGSADGQALESTFTRPGCLGADNKGNIIISDDYGLYTSGRIRLMSLQDNKVSTLMTELFEPWQGAFNSDYSRYFVCIRPAGKRPVLGYILSQSTNWLDANVMYAQKDENGKDCFDATNHTFGLTTDDKYVYFMTMYGTQLIRMDQVTGKMEVIGRDLGLARWSMLTFNKQDKHIYTAGTEQGRLYRLDPYKKDLVASDLEIWAGSSRLGAPIEGNGADARFGKIYQIDSDPEGNVYMADLDNHVIWIVDKDRNVKVFAGTVTGGKGVAGYKDGPLLEAQFNQPCGVTVAPDGVIYVSEWGNVLIRSIAVQ